MCNELAIEASGLAKSYGAVRVLGGIDLRVPRGSVFALLFVVSESLTNITKHAQASQAEVVVQRAGDRPRRSTAPSRSPARPAGRP
jgi:signal transduction histidine kinase